MKMAPYYQPHKATCGAGLSKENPLDGATFAYPIFSAYGSAADDQIYAMTKLMIVEYPNYKDSAPGADGFDVKKQSLEWAIPYHPGAIKALKEAGVWTDKAEKHNQALLKRQDILASTWKSYNETKPADDKFLAGWMAARGAALKKASLDVVFE